MRALVIDQTAKEDIAKVVKYAFEHKMDIKIMLELVAGEIEAPGFSPNYTCEIFDGYRVVFSIEEHPTGWCRHISISVPGGKLPSVEAAYEIIKKFGFENTLRNCITRIEEMPHDIERPRAIEIIEKLHKTSIHQFLRYQGSKN